MLKKITPYATLTEVMAEEWGIKILKSWLSKSEKEEDDMNDDELLSLVESYLEDHDPSELMRVVADALESVGH